MITTLFIGPVGPMETILIIGAVVLLFGADKIPKLAKSVGEAKEKVKEGRMEARKEMEEIEQEVQKDEE